ncbi:autotransporter domain-containing protein [Brucella anthropi]|uniref:autotransporter domain-containing protein n=1 Tax=Brucella anthropi TaxID=529 RepID=UPI00124E8334|nr:autotransporter domain-containing protein [Brucella anthropi]KAB2786784.1 autotransporter domain-containing protein [Brucella anthropi]QOD66413.1 autotransporter domain-containing protein [Ochrobactrum sp. MT180101]
MAPETIKPNRKFLALATQLSCCVGVSVAGTTQARAVKLGLTAAGALFLLSSGSGALAQGMTGESHSLTIMGFNIWNNGANSKMWDADEKAKGNLVYNQKMQDLLRGVAPDVLIMPELYNNSGKVFNGQSVVGAHVQNTLDLLNSNPGKLGIYQKNKDYDAREGSGMVFASGNVQSLGNNTILVNPGNGFSDVIIEGRHLNYYDEPTNRIVEAKQLAQAAQTRTLPTIVAGDFNAGDVSERGLLSIDAQIRLMKKASGQNFYARLAYEYMAAGDEAISHKIIQDAHPSSNINNLTWRQWADALDAAYRQGADTGLKDETYPVTNNEPVTLNILKQQYQLMQLERNRELFKPSEMGDGRATWTSDGEDATNIWESWDRVNIDHIMVSRPFAKWVEIVDNGKWSGTLSEAARLPNGNSLSDHEPIAQELRWTGPQIQTYKEGETEKSRLVWGAGAYGFETRNNELVLTRNNHRADVYLGQISDADGKSTLNDLTLEEKKTLLDCESRDARFQQAIKDYCIDDHSFIGETAVTDGGTILVSEDAALGNADARLRLIDGGLRITGSDMKTLDRTVSLEGLGWIDIADANNRVTLLQQATGEGALLKRGAGTLVLGQANSYTGGTSVEGGVLQAGVDGAFVDNTAFSVNGGKLDLNNFNVSMSSLMGEGGTLSLGSAALTVDQSANTRFDGNIDGTGSLAKSGTGVLVLNGDNTYTGGTTVKEGGLVIGDASHSGAFLVGTASVENGAYLAGAGSVGGLYAGAGSIIAPGNSIGTLKVNGNLAFDAGATYVAEIDASGKSDRIDVNGTATLGGAKVYIEKAAGTYMPGKRYTILRAGAGITGTFGDLSQNMPFVDLGLTHDPNTVYLNIARNDVDFAATAKTGNQKSVAVAVEGLGAGNAVYDTVVMQDSEEDARRAFDALSGEIHASTRTAIINDSSIVRNAVMERVDAAFGGSGQSAASSSVATDMVSSQVSAPRAAIWGQALGQWSETGADGNAGKLKQSTGGFVAGYDAEVVENWRLGTLAGYSRTSFDVNDRNSSGHSSNYHLGIYGGTQWAATLLKAGVGYSWHKIETDRVVAFPGFSESLDAGYSANTFQAFGELSQRFDLKGTAIEPFANVAVVRLKTDRFNENGGNAALQIRKETTTSTFTTLGLRASTPVVFGGMNAKLNGAVGWQHAYGDTIPTAAAAFDAGTVFEVAGASIARDTAIIKAGLDIDLGNQTTLGLEYSGQYGSSFNQNTAKAKFILEF